MNRKMFLLVVAVVGLALAGLGGQTALAGGGSRSPVLWFEDTEPHADPDVADAWSMLQRHSNGVTGIFHTNNLIPGHVYTLWWVLFNNPEACLGGAEGCGPTTVGAALMSGENPAGAGVLRADGGVANAAGKLTLGDGLKVGDTSGCQTSDPFAGVCTSLTNPKGAVILMVVHDHGPAIPGEVGEQMGSFEGGCYSYINGATGDVNIVYDLGSYECFSPQASPHVP